MARHGTSNYRALSAVLAIGAQALYLSDVAVSRGLHLPPADRAALGGSVFPYWFLFSIYAVGAINHTRNAGSTVRSSPLFVVAAFLTAFIIGFRYEVGGDWFNYISIYTYAGYTRVGEILAGGDPAYIFVNWLGRALDFDIWFVNIVCAFCFTWGLVKFAQRQPNPWLAVAVAVPYLIIVVAMGYTRQAVAIGFLMAGLAAFERGSVIRFLMYAIFAAAFHKSAVVVLPLVALSAVRYRLAIYTTGAALGAVLFMVFLDTFLDRLFANYIDSEMSSDGTGVRVAMNVFPALIFLSFQRRFSSSEQERKQWRNFCFAAIATLVALLLVPSSTVVDRVALYLIPLQIYVLSRLPYVFPDKGRPNSQLILGVLAYSAAIQLVWLTQATHAHAWLPYKIFPLLT